MSSLIGAKFGRLTVTSTFMREGRRHAHATCDCGVNVTPRIDGLRSGRSQSCGCLALEKAVETCVARNTTHALAGTPEYSTWKAIKNRCYNSRSEDFRLYGEKGIEVCPEWIEDPVQFLQDMGPRPEGMTIERRDSRGPYSKENCYWASAKVQANNTSRNALLTHVGITKTMAQWAEFLGINYSTLRDRRARGWSDSEALGL